ncbi:MAG: phospholipase D-like domain-containing protein [Aquamicrobium sp.]|uniref:phospholipase D-like domain-containing protein n=1 Tax=Aquamicrobium sp. TaxID=1872579 RepID=UPI00349E7223|nr:phospholipase D-like domain-containing protein [Aquamicrobium sp.]
MWSILSDYWPHILAVISVLMAVPAIVHVVMNKEEVRSAIGWVGVILLSPVIGALIYAIGGINRIRRASIISERRRAIEHDPRHQAHLDASRALVADLFGERFAAMKTLGDRVAKHAMTVGNAIRLLDGGDETYAQMIAEIDAAQRSIILETYIFDRDAIGLRLAEALARAHRRGVAVRVLIDAVGVRYSVPSIVGTLESAGIAVDLFNGSLIMGLRLPYANLRTHRKIIVVDGAVAFVGGMNIRKGFTSEFARGGQARDTHFRVTGPVVADIFSTAAEDWRFTTDEDLDGEAWRIEPLPAVQFGAPVFIRAVASGPDAALETNHRMLMGAFSVARRSIRIISPYFLPDRELVSALATAGRRGVEIDIVVPAQNNLVLVERAMIAQFEQVLKNYCRVWRADGPFDHSKLLAVDGVWAFVGSSNLDPRSLRLNFEIDVEVLDADFAGMIESRIDTAIASAQPVTVEGLRARPFPLRLFDRILWLGSPYL